MKELDRALNYWAVVSMRERDLDSTFGNNRKYQIECNNKILENRDYDAYVALLAAFLAYDDVVGTKSILKKDLYDFYQANCPASKPTVYKRINNTIDAVGWFVDKSGRNNIIDLSLGRYINSNIETKVRGYIVLSPLEILSLLDLKDPTAIKVYLKLKQKNALTVGKGRDLKQRMVTITGQWGLAATLGFAPTNRKTILEALQLLQQHYLINYTSGLVRENMRGKYVLINAIMGDSSKRWISYNLKTYSEGYINSQYSLRLPDGFQENNVLGYGSLSNEEVEEDELDEMIVVAQEDLSKFIPAQLYIQECELGITNHSEEALEEWKNLDDDQRRLIEIKYNS